LIYIEAKEKKSAKFDMNEIYTTKDEFVAWIKELARKGNVTRIKIKKDEKVVIDIPVNAGIAVGIIGLSIPYLFGIGLFAAVVTKVTIEITKADGSVEVINTIIKNTVDDVVSKMSDMGDEVKEKYNETKDSFSKGNKDNKDSNETKDSSTDNVYQYTVKFEEKDKEEE
jgi:CBS domain-containing protein